jgi:hypothetical protein
MGILSVLSESEYKKSLPQLGHDGVLGIFLKIDDSETDRFGIELKDRIANDRLNELYLDHAKLPKKVIELAGMVADYSMKIEPKSSKTTPRSFVFGIPPNSVSSLHVDTQVAQGRPQIPVFGSWFNLIGDSSVFLKEASGFSPDEINDDLNILGIDSNDGTRKFYIKPEAKNLFEKQEVFGPTIGSWAIGMSESSDVKPVLHQVETNGDELRLSINVF